MGQAELWSPFPTSARPQPGWAAAYLAARAAEAEYQDEWVHVEVMPSRPALHDRLSEPLPPWLAAALTARDIDQLYAHQVEAIERARAGRDVVVVTGTASGKSLCYHVPILETLGGSPDATALFLYPTKALAQDQLAVLNALLRGAGMADGLAGTFDGDTTGHARRRLRDRGQLLLTNPDMLHQTLLPHHTRWSRFLGALSWVVLDEIHVYRGIFGSHVANVLRRLLRLAHVYGAMPKFIASSATIQNPTELAAALTGRRMALVDGDGAPRGPRTFAFWNPPTTDAAGFQRRLAAVDAAQHLVELVTRGVQTIVFAKSRVSVELILRYARQQLAERRPDLVDRIHGYRAGYLPSERRDIEARLRRGELLAVLSTNALELGIDIGGLDAAILVGFPPTIASAWQEAGRAGRGTAESLVIVVAADDPIDQYFMRHPAAFFGAPTEAAVADPDNPYVVAGHVGCAAHEQPLDPGGAALFGAQAHDVAVALAADGQLKHTAERFFWAQPELPSRRVNLRTMSDDTYTIMAAAPPNAVLGTVDGISALELIYPQAVYMHDSVTYCVRELDLEQKIAFVEECAVDYYTQAVVEHWIRVDGEETARPSTRSAATPTRWPVRPAESVPVAIDADGSADHWCHTAPQATCVAGERAPRLALGEVEVSWQTIAMRKIRFGGRDSIGYHTLDLPRLMLPTRAMWLWVGEALLTDIKARHGRPFEALSGLRNVLLTAAPLYTMADPKDLGAVINSANTGRPCVFLYDRYPGGIGFCDRLYSDFEALLGAGEELVRSCPCPHGCPACVGLTVLNPAQQLDADLATARPIPDKRATLRLMEALQASLGADCPGV